jgi:hypothetical protein
LLIFHFIDQLDEKTIDESDSISLDRSNSTTPKKPSTPVSRQFANTSFVDESLRDEDAWMSILAVADAEVKLNKQKFLIDYFLLARCAQSIRK